MHGWRLCGGRRSRWTRYGATAVLAALIGVACSQGEQQGAPSTAPSAPSAPAPGAAGPAPATEPATPSGPGDPAKGKQVYAINCTACHNADPAKDGALGPPIAGSSLELVAARVVRGEYPPGYTPKRPTRQMVPLPHLAAAVPDLVAYLQDPGAH